MEENDIIYHLDDSYNLVAGSESVHRRNCYEIDWLASGHGGYYRNGTWFEMNAGDVVVFNPFERHAVEIEFGGFACRILITDTSMFRECAIINIDVPYFICDPTTINENNLDYYRELREAVANLMLDFARKQKYWEVSTTQYRYKILYILFSCFAEAKGSTSHPANHEFLQILQYIHGHLCEPLSLNVIAEKFFISTSYLSRIFQKNLSVTPAKYIARERTFAAAQKLASTEEKIVDIALDCGFSGLRSMENSFNRFYGVSPQEYRKISPGLVNKVQIREPEKAEVINIIRGTLQKDSTDRITSQINNRVIVPQYRLNVGIKGKKMPDSWNKLVNVAHANDILDADIQKRLVLVKKEIDFAYIHFHGLFDDEMRVYNENSAGIPVIQFGFVNKVLDFVINTGYKPYLELGFMPEKLASIKDNRFGKFHSKPKSQSKWNTLVSSLLENCIKRYGIDEVNSWIIQIWDSANINYWWCNTQEEFLSFYSSTYSVIRQRLPEVRIAMPSINTIGIRRTEWLEQFLRYTKRCGCVPDIISISVYPHEQFPGSSIKDNMLILTGNDFGTTVPPSRDSDYFRNAIKLLKQKLRAEKLEDLPVYVTQWNINNIPVDYSRDTVQTAGYVLKNMIENFRDADAFGYWFLTDEKEEYNASSIPFCGGMGMITHEGLKLPVYRALEFLKMMKGRIVFSEEGLLATSFRKNIYILLYNDVWYKNDVCDGNVSLNRQETDRYSVFEKGFAKSISIRIDGIARGTYRICEYIMNQQFGSCYDLWCLMGEAPVLTKEDAGYLSAVSVPAMHVANHSIMDICEINRIIEPFEVRLIKIEENDA